MPIYVIKNGFLHCGWSTTTYNLGQKKFLPKTTYNLREGVLFCLNCTFDPITFTNRQFWPLNF